jgi:hypothetical protein
MRNPLTANGADIFRIIGDMKNVRFARNGRSLGKKYISQQDRLFRS